MMRWLWMRSCALRRVELFFGIVGRETWASTPERAVRCGPVLAWQVARIVHPWGEVLPR